MGIGGKKPAKTLGSPSGVTLLVAPKCCRPGQQPSPAWGSPSCQNSSGGRTGKPTRRGWNVVTETSRNPLGLNHLEGTVSLKAARDAGRRKPARAHNDVKSFRTSCSGSCIENLRDMKKVQFYRLLCVYQTRTVVWPFADARIPVMSSELVLHSKRRKLQWTAGRTPPSLTCPFDLFSFSHAIPGRWSLHSVRPELTHIPGVG